MQDLHPGLIRRRDQNLLTLGERALVSLLNTAGMAIESFYRAGQHGRLVRQLEALSA